MRYTEFRDSVRNALRTRASGLTWVQLREGLALPYNRPCPAWTKQLEREIGLTRVKGKGRELVWVLGSGSKSRRSPASPPA